MEAVGAVVDGKLIADTIDGEVTTSDAVSIATTNRAEVGFFAVDIFVEAIVSEDNIRIATTAGDYEGDELSTLVDEVCFGSCLISKRVELDGLAVDDPTEGLGREPGFVLLHSCNVVCWSKKPPNGSFNVVKYTNKYAYCHGS